MVDPDGKRIGKYAPNEYTDWIAEHVEPWTYLKFPYLKKVGWKGFVDGKDSGVYCATPLSRLNAADGMATPLAQEEYEKFYKHAGRQAGASAPGDALGAADRAALRRRALGGAGDRPGDHVRQLPHHPDRETDRRRGHRRSAARHADPSLHGPTSAASLTKVNLIVGTTNNYAPISMSIKKAAQSLIKKGTVVTEGAAEHGRDGLPRLRSVLRLRHAHRCPARCRWRSRSATAQGEIVDVLKQNC